MWHWLLYTDLITADLELRAHCKRDQACCDRGTLPRTGFRATGNLHTGGTHGGLTSHARDPIVEEVHRIPAAYVFVLLTPTPTCVGDCNGDGQVTVDDILTMVNIALGNANISTCLAGDANHDGQITVDEILTAVDNALNGCVQSR